MKQLLIYSTFLLFALNMPIAVALGAESKLDATNTPAANRPVGNNSKLHIQRQRYREAVAHVRQTGGNQDYTFFRKELEGYPLLSHLDFIALSQSPETLTTENITLYMGDREDRLYAQKLHRQKLRWLIKQKDWTGFTHHYSSIPESLGALLNKPEIACQNATAQYRLGNRETALETAGRLWMTPRSMPKDCDALFHLLQSNGSISNAMAWQRYTGALANGKTKLAKYLKRFLTGDNLELARRIERTYESPTTLEKNWISLRMALLSDTALSDNQRSAIAMTLIRRLARKSPEQATSFVASYSPFKNGQFVSDEKSDTAIRNYIVQRQALSNYQNVKQVYTQLGSPSTDENNNWLLRSALAQGNWRDVIALTDAAPDSLRTTSRWQYWALRARQLLGELNDDQQIAFEQLARQANFYGFSAAHWLDLPATIAPLTDEPTQTALSQLLDLVPLQRATEHYIQGNKAEADRFWNRAMAKIASEHLMTAAYFAGQLGWHSQAIGTAARDKAWRFYELRFPNQYSDAFKHAATRYQQPPHWFYATARQESALAPHAVSGAGAVGLMQVLPSTAKEVARKLSLPYGRAMLLEPEYSIRIGSAYLDQLYQRYDSRVLSSAAYNAGPRRVNNWLGKLATDLPIDAWIETIVFDETRQYVQNILSFASIYQLLHQQNSTAVATLPPWPKFTFYEPGELIVSSSASSIAQR